MNKKGFTLVELLAVIVILGLLVGIATLSVTAIRKKAKEKEITTIRQSILASFENYRINNNVLKNIEINIANLDFDSINYRGNKCIIGNNDVISYVTKDNLLEEVFCIKLTCNDEILINDYESNNTYCK